ncbi:MAG: hypothetical protein HY505_01725 [Candidatus Yanofskybacteria bacterium]|nr:hypothetical protein [Candidatus Yanofskybacteria bacterium]
MYEQTAAELSDPSDVFGMMVVSSAFEPRSASIEEKRQIFGKAWFEDVSRLRSNFDSAGRDPRTESFGFGFLVEAFARHSRKIPRQNTESGERAAQAILSELHSGKQGRIRLGSRQSNSDFLWVRQTGRRIVVTGIGEIKSSYQAAKDKIGGQLKRQERSVGYLAEELKTAKLNGSVSGFFQKRGVEVADNLEKFIIVPFGEGEEVRHDNKFSDWQVVEIEYSYNELVFIAQQIWLDFRPDVKFSPGKLANLDRIAVQLGEWIRPRLDDVFSDSTEFGCHNPLPYFELGLFTLATGKTPLTEDEVRWSAELVGNSFWPAVQRCLNFFLTSELHPEADFSREEEERFKKFRYVLTSDRSDLEHLLYFIRSLNAEVKELASSQDQLEQLRGMSEVWKI